MRATVRDEHGFTLIELMITVMIIANLAAIALGAYNGQRNRAHNAHAKNSLRVALTAAESYFSEKQTFWGNDTPYYGQPDLSKVEKSIKWSWTESAGNELGGAGHGSREPGDGADPKEVELYVYGPAPEQIVLCAASKGNRAYCLRRIHEEGDVRTCYQDSTQSVDVAGWWSGGAAVDCVNTKGFEH